MSASSRSELASNRPPRPLREPTPKTKPTPRTVLSPARVSSFALAPWCPFLSAPSQTPAKARPKPKNPGPPPPATTRTPTQNGRKGSEKNLAGVPGFSGSGLRFRSPDSFGFRGGSAPACWFGGRRVRDTRKFGPCSAVSECAESSEHTRATRRAAGFGVVACSFSGSRISRAISECFGWLDAFGISAKSWFSVLVSRVVAVRDEFAESS